MALVTPYSRFLADASFAGAVRELDSILGGVQALRSIDDAIASRPRSPGKWSKKEILGHLIDSASNNLQRFVRAQIPAHLDGGILRLPGYAPDDWVRVGDYAARRWIELVDLWSALNQHLLHILRRFDPSKLETNCSIGGAEPVRIEFVIVDYVGHLRHHLVQLDAERNDGTA
jgi:hypothetical protein